jgi:hypothetical protein
MHAYCVGALGLSEDSAWKRIRVARLARAFPEVLDMIADGRVHLSAVVLLSPHLTRKNAAALFAAATQKTKRQIEASGRAIPAAGRAGAGPGHRAGARSPEAGPGASLAPPCEPASSAEGVAGLPVAPPAPRPELAPGPVFVLPPVPVPAALAPPAPQPRVTPLTPERYAVQFTKRPPHPCRGEARSLEP